jgi:hypothetical protein
LDNSGAAALYYRCAGEDYCDRQRCEQTFRIAAEAQTLRFAVDRGLRDIEALRLRLIARAPAEPIAYIKIHSLSIAPAGADPQAAPEVALLGHAQLTGHFTLSGLALDDALLGEMYAVEDGDPFLECRTSSLPPVSAEWGLRVEIALEYLPGGGFILARDAFIAGQERLEERVRCLESERAELEAESQELERYKRSALWPAFVRAQTLFDRLSGALGQGPIRASLRVFSPQWWSRRGLNDYERWRTANGYENRPGK